MSTCTFSILADIIWNWNCFDFKSSPDIQVLVQTAYFLLLVRVAVFFPGFPHHLWCSLYWADRSAAQLVAHNGLNPLGECPHIFLMEEVLVNHIFNSPDFPLFACRCGGEVTEVRVYFQEIVVLRLEVLHVDMRRRMAVQKLSADEILQDVSGWSGLIRLAVRCHKASHVSISHQHLLRGGRPIGVFIFSWSDDVEAIGAF